MEKVYADNCQACGVEYLSTDLTPVKLGYTHMMRIKICKKCMSVSDPAEDLVEAASIILSLGKNG